MEELKERILKEGKFIKPDILKVDSFLNHMVDAKLLRNIAMEFKKAFSSENITKIVTIESRESALRRFAPMSSVSPLSLQKNITPLIWTRIVFALKFFLLPNKPLQISGFQKST